MKKRILTIVGARPQFIKAAALSREIKKHADLEEIIIHTGQHFDDKMSDIFFRQMEIPPPKHRLDIHSLTHGAMTGRMLEGIENVLLTEKPDMVLVYGDTNSTIAGALAARKLHLPVGHVEAGLRSFNMQMPEEINRLLVDRISALLFCPTHSAVENLEREGYEHFDCEILRSGDVMQDAAEYYAKKASANSNIIEQLDLENTPYVLCTIHRAENTDAPNRLKSICHALEKIHKETQVVIPLHPRTSSMIKDMGGTLNVTRIDPVGYFDMIELLHYCSLVMTDSGGLQKEAFFFNKHCITMRDQTEWVELVQHGFNQLVGSNENLIYDSYKYTKNKISDFEVDLYGSGKACANIVNSLKDYFDR